MTRTYIFLCRITNLDMQCTIAHHFICILSGVCRIQYYMYLMQCVFLFKDPDLTFLASNSLQTCFTSPIPICQILPESRLSEEFCL